MNSSIKHVSDASFDSDVINAKGLVLVDFWAEWCGPCKAIAPALEEVGLAYIDRLTVAKVNVDENEATPRRFSIRSIPTLMLFKDGKSIGTKVGAVSRSELDKFLREHV